MSSNWAESALSWWEEAGVDTFVGETPRDWLAEKPKVPPAPDVAAAPAPPPEPPPLALPDNLDAFRAWFTDGASLSLGAPGAPRLGPSGAADAGLMVMVDMPAIGDIAAGNLLSGEAGDLFDKMIGAIGQSRETIWLASMSPFRTPSGRLDGETAATLATIARHHIGLVRPKALLLFGDVCAKALIGEPVLEARQRWHEVATQSGRVKTLATLKPESLQSRELKRLAWDDLKMLMEELKA